MGEKRSHTATCSKGIPFMTVDVYHLTPPSLCFNRGWTAGRISTREEEGGPNSEATWVHWRPSDMQDTLSAVPVKHVRINSGCLPKGGGGKVFSEKPVGFSSFRKLLYPPYHYIQTHMCTHISITDIKSSNKHGQVLSQSDKAWQVSFQNLNSPFKSRELK